MADDAHNGAGKGEWICVIGGGKSQLPFVRAARRLGAETLVFDRDPDAPARAAATRFEACSTHDAGEIVRRCEAFFGERAPRGCLTYSSHEKALLSAAAVTERYGLEGIPRETVRRTTSKEVWKGLLSEAGIPTPAWIRLGAGEEPRLEAFLERHGSAVLKPSRGSAGSSGVAVLEAGDSGTAELLGRACGASSDGEAIAEEHLKGEEYSVDGCVWDGSCRVLGVSRKHVGTPGRPFLIEGFQFDGAPEPPNGELRRLAGEVCRALDLENTFFSLDVICDGERRGVIDLGPLLDAKLDRLLDHAGAGIYELGVRLALPAGGEPFPIGDEALRAARGCALRFIYAAREGRLANISPGLRAGKGAGGEAFSFVLELEKRPGERVRPPRSLADAAGWVIHCGGDAEASWRRLSAVERDELFAVE